MYTNDQLAERIDRQAETLDRILNIVQNPDLRTQFVQDIEEFGYVDFFNPPQATTAGTETVMTFTYQVKRVIIQNNTAVNVAFAFDQTATAGSLLLVPNTILIYPKKVLAVHLWTATAQNINSGGVPSIVVLGAN